MTDERTCQELREHNEELQTRVQALEVAVDHWRYLYKTLDALYQEVLKRD